MSKKRQATDALAAMLDRILNPSSHSAPRKGAAMDWNKFATPTEITNNDLLDVIGDVYMRGKGDVSPSRIVLLIFKFARGKGYTEIPQARRADFLNALAKL
jgi:hypothetical protein